MRIIAGSARGARLGPVPPGVRPVSDRAREGLFSSLGDRVLDAEVLDLYAGTGALGIEALSRGAERATFVESGRRAATAVRANLASVRLESRAAVRQRPVLSFLRAELRAPAGAMIAFLDPPYATPVEEVEEALRALDQGWQGVGSWTVVLTRPLRNDRIVIPVNWQLGVRRQPRHPVSGGLMGSTALCPGTFDPVTNGHLDIIGRASRRFDQLVVGVLDNPSKAPLFSVEERVAMLKAVTSDLHGVEVASFSGLLVDFAESRGIGTIVKGLRAVSDFDYELQMAQMNHRLRGVETFFMSTDPNWSYLSSSLVREVARFGGDVSSLVPEVVVARLAERLGSAD